MFREVKQVDPAVGSLYENDAAALEELKQGPSTFGALPSHTRTLNEGALSHVRLPKEGIDPHSFSITDSHDAGLAGYAGLPNIRRLHHNLKHPKFKAY